MKSATVRAIKSELKENNKEELLELCLRLSKFKKENKELLTYLLFYGTDESSYIEKVKEEIQNQFQEINTSTYYFIKKSVRKILRNTKKHIRYSSKKETEVDLLIYFCLELMKMKPSIKNNVTLVNLFNRQLDVIKKAISSLHEDLQFDYQEDMETLDSI